MQVLFRAADGAVAGQIFDVYIYTDADGDPATGAVLAGSLLNQSITALETYQTYNLAAPLRRRSARGPATTARPRPRRRPGSRPPERVRSSGRSIRSPSRATG